MKGKTYWYNNARHLVWLFGILLAILTLTVAIIPAACGLLSVLQAVILLIVLILLSAVILVSVQFLVVQPMKHLQHACELFNRGYIYTEFFHNNFCMDPEMEEAFLKLETMAGKQEAAEMAGKQVELLTLQSQMNPHFLYNTLDSIRAEALINGQCTIAEMTEALSKYFRYTITNKDILVSLADELDNVSNYFLIQKYRFEDRIDLTIHYDEEDWMLHCRIPKLTVQPLVENAIQHGIESGTGRGSIEVEFERTETHVFLSVRNVDSRGMTEAEIDALNRSFRDPAEQSQAVYSKRKSGISLRNINARIKLLFGMEYGIHIMGSVDTGTEVRVTLPFLTEAEAATYETISSSLGGSQH